MPVKKREERKPRRRQPTRNCVCAQCGETVSGRMVRHCSICRTPLHPWCVLHHHVDSAGDGMHPERDYSHLNPVG